MSERECKILQGKASYEKRFGSRRGRDLWLRCRFSGAYSFRRRVTFRPKRTIQYEELSVTNAIFLRYIRRFDWDLDWRNFSWLCLRLAFLPVAIRKSAAFEIIARWMRQKSQWPYPPEKFDCEFCFFTFASVVIRSGTLCGSERLEILLHEKYPKRKGYMR